VEFALTITGADGREQRIRSSKRAADLLAIIMSEGESSGSREAIQKQKLSF